MEHIKETLVKSQAEHSTTLNKEEIEKKCKECDKVFQDNLWFRPDGSPMGTYDKCPDCREKKEQLKSSIIHSSVEEKKLRLSMCILTTRMNL